MLARYTPTNTMLMFTWDIIITPTIHMSCLHFPRTWSLANMSCYCCQFQTILCTLEIDDQCRGHRIKQKDHPTGSSPRQRHHPPTRHQLGQSLQSAAISGNTFRKQGTRRKQTNKTKIIVAQRHWQRHHPPSTRWARNFNLEPLYQEIISEEYQKTRNTAQTNKTIQDKTRQSSSGKSKNCYQSCERKKIPKKLIRTSQLWTPWLRGSY